MLIEDLAVAQVFMVQCGCTRRGEKLRGSNPCTATIFASLGSDCYFTWPCFFQNLRT